MHAMNALRAALGILMAGSVAFGSAVAVHADETSFESYVYDEWGAAVPAPPLYAPDFQISGTSLGIGSFKGAQDLFYQKDLGLVFLVDSGNNRIVILDEELEVVRILDKLAQGLNPLTLSTPGGIFVTKEGSMYITDSEKGRIVVADLFGKVTRIYGPPVSELIGDGFTYKPQKIVLDRAGRMYVQATGVFEGLLCFDSEGRFLQYFGSNRVEMTAAMLIARFWKTILSQEQKGGLAGFIPIEYSNIAIGEDDFLYATVVKSTNSLNEIKKLNALGNNILRISPFSTTLYPRNDYGDHPVAWVDAKPVDSMFSDILVDQDGWIAALDARRGRIFLYDEDSNLLGALGGSGEQLGTFKQPSSIVSVQGRLLVLDAMKNNLTVLSSTEFGNQVRQAMRLYSDGRYMEAVEPWKRVLVRCSNYNLAYIGLGKASMRTGDYPAAMRWFRLGYDKKGYSDALQELTLEIGRRNLPYFLVAIALGLLGLRALRRRGRGLRRKTAEGGKDRG